MSQHAVPLMFKAPLVRAILDGQKTVTRRLVRHPERLERGPVGQHPMYQHAADCRGGVGVCDGRCDGTTFGHSGQVCGGPAAYAPGWWIWIRESWRAPRSMDGLAPLEIPQGTAISYEATGGGGAGVGRLRPGIHLPRWASRITLEIVDARIEPLQAISEAQAQAEGLRPAPSGFPGARVAFEATWDQIYGERAPWASNPWVWAITFRRIR